MVTLDLGLDGTEDMQWHIPCVIKGWSITARPSLSLFEFLVYCVAVLKGNGKLLG